MSVCLSIRPSVRPSVRLSVCLSVCAPPPFDANVAFKSSGNSNNCRENRYIIFFNSPGEREGGREGGRKGGRKGGREGGREEGREGVWEGGREGTREPERSRVSRLEGVDFTSNVWNFLRLVRANGQVR